ncbi:hypothetical protein R1flu_004955 [Riccia fluitans]|uniref:Uncharacterized protein n=1 Tax=Riccia fluitans TaxID=41844 RepID=A0ABD1YRT1_9MARC
MSEFSKPAQPRAKMVVAIDFGTTYSGFAYAQTSDIEKVYLFYEWPGQHFEKPYCKTKTSLMYMPTPGTGDYELKDWGLTAFWKYKMGLQESRSPASSVPHADKLKDSCYLATKFKLHLAPADHLGQKMFSVAPLPQGLTVKRLIADYLKSLSGFIMKTLQNNFGLILKKDIQWCLTVPALWDEAAKQQMVECAEIAGLVKGALCTDHLASPHAVIIVLEPEAASVYCQRKLKDTNFSKGSKFLVVDAGGGTVDLVVHEKVDNSGIKDFSAQYPATVLKFQEYIEKVKCGFDGEADSFYPEMEVPAKLAKAWKAYDIERGRPRGKGAYDTLRLLKDDVVSILSEVVGKILRLIGDQLDANPGVETILVVGGFSNSPYLMRKIRERFSTETCRILNPPDPGGAVCQGAVAFGLLNAEVMLSRKSRKTYGMDTFREYQIDDPPEKQKISERRGLRCQDAFFIFVKKGDDVAVNTHVKKVLVPVESGQSGIDLTLYATDDTSPKFITDPGVELVASWSYDFPGGIEEMDDDPEVEVQMLFGRTMIEMTAKPVNFEGPTTSMSMNFEREYR